MRGKNAPSSLGWQVLIRLLPFWRRFFSFLVLNFIIPSLLFRLPHAFLVTCLCHLCSTLLRYSHLRLPLVNPKFAAWISPILLWISPSPSYGGLQDFVAASDLAAIRIPCELRSASPSVIWLHPQPSNHGGRPRSDHHEGGLNCQFSSLFFAIIRMITHWALWIDWKDTRLLSWK